MIRQPIICMLGHVDHGKTTILDRIRKSAVQKREAGGITQHIGATEVPIEVIKQICGNLLRFFPVKFRIPGLLFIDTPGHEAFTNLRKRGGSIADLAVLVVDVNSGFQPQTYEAIEILKAFKVPFLVAANKIDLIPGWKSKEDRPITEALKEQSPEALAELEKRIYDIVGKLYELGFEADRFDRVSDFRRQVVIVPVSGKTGEGIPELLMFLAGLSQKFLEEKLRISVSGPGKGVILEVREERGLGTTIDVILYDGILEEGDRIVFGSLSGPKITKIRALLKPKPLDEIRDPRDKFDRVKKVSAAAGVKIAAPELEEAIAGAPVVKYTGPESVEFVKKELASVEISTDEIGVILKADTLGSLEAITKFLRSHGIPVRKAEIGDVTKTDVVEAAAIAKQDPFLGIILAFNVGVTEEAEEEARASGVEILIERIIYRLVEKYEEWKEKKREQMKLEALKKLVWPGKIKILPGFVFRRSKPAIVGVRVLCGRIAPKYDLMREDGTVIGTIRSIQSHGQSLESAEEGMEVAIAIDGPTIGRQVKEGDILYTYVPKDHIESLLSSGFLSDAEKELLLEIRKLIRRRKNEGSDLGP